MNTGVTIPSYFPTPAENIGPAAPYLRTGTTPVPFTIALVKLDDLETALQDPFTCEDSLSFLTAEEASLFHSFKYPKRRREWLGGRLAAKHAVVSLMAGIGAPMTMRDFSVLPSPSGAPMIVGSMAAHERPALSISHSDRFGVAMAAKAETCGIDVQKITEQTHRVADRFSDGEELKLLEENTPSLSTRERLTLLWAAKEAVKKAMLSDQPAIFKGVILRSLTGDHRDSRYTLHLRFPGGGDTTAAVTALQLENCFLAHTILPRESSHA